MNIKNLLCAIISLVLLWSCGKDDGTTPTPEDNNAPKIDAQSFTVAEDISDTATIGTVKATDADQDELTFSISETDLFEIDDVGKLSLIDGKNLDYELTREHSIKVSVSDGIDGTEANITIIVTDVVESLAENADSFVTLWAIPEDNFEIIIGTNPDYDYNYTIDWGDGTQEELTIQNPSHTYTSAGEYKVAIQGDFPAIKMGHSDLINVSGLEIVKSLIGLEQWGAIVWENFNNGFANCINMEYYAADIPNLQNVEDMSGMFANHKLYDDEAGLAFNFPSVFDGNLDDWDVSNVTNMENIFLNCDAFNGDISGWDVSNVTDMSAMFAGASSFNADLSNWNVSNVTDMGALFNGAFLFNADISGWDVSNVTNMSNMFAHANAFDADISEWNVSNVTNMNGMFAYHTTFNGDISGWDVGNVANMGGMFYYSESFNGDISGWDVGNVTNMVFMFSGAQSFNMDIGDWNIASVSSIAYMFYNAGAFNKDISAWDVSNITDMSGMFSGAVSFNQSLADWNVENVTYIGNIFSDSGVSPENYGATLVGWANLENTPEGITLGANNVEYCLESGAATARETLINDFGWTFSGDTGIDCN